MAIRWVMSGGNFLFNNPGAAGISVSHNSGITNACPTGTEDTFALTNGTGTVSWTTPNLGGNYSSLYAGYRMYPATFANGRQLITFFDQSGNNQCDLRCNGTGQLFMTRNGTTILGPSTASLTIAAWNYIELGAIFSTTGAGTGIVRLNSVTILSSSALTNSTTTTAAAQVEFISSGTGTEYIKSLYVVDGGTPSAPFTLTAVDGTGDYTGTITGGAGNAYAGYKFTITGFTNADNNVVGAICTGSSVSTLSFSYLTTTIETHAGSAANYGSLTNLGDVKIIELYPNGAGVNSAWTPNVGPFSITTVGAASGGNQAFNGTITGGTGNAYVGYNFVTSGFANGVNNSGSGGFICTASSGTSLTLTNPTGVSDTTGSAAFQNIVQIGINQTGTRPNSDVAYLVDSTPGDISDFAHTALTLAGSVLGACHLSYARKDDAGARSIAQVCLSSGTTEQSPPVSLNNTYTYLIDILETDPHTGSAFTTSGLNSATFGVKEIT